MSRQTFGGDFLHSFEGMCQQFSDRITKQVIEALGKALKQIFKDSKRGFGLVQQ